MGVYGEIRHYRLTTMPATEQFISDHQGTHQVAYKGNFQRSLSVPPSVTSVRWIETNGSCYWGWRFGMNNNLHDLFANADATKWRFSNEGRRTLFLPSRKCNNKSRIVRAI